MVPVAHKSGGPLMDIVTDYNNKPTGMATIHWPKYLQKEG
jgi:uncharacterized protein YodC (DUF2158 family)